jgi:hypothetical protein
MPPPTASPLLTSGFSENVENLEHAVSLHFLDYNCARQRSRHGRRGGALPCADRLFKNPARVRGQWVVVRMFDQQPLGFGETLQAAIEQAGIVPGQEGVIIGRVPSGLVVL